MTSRSRWVVLPVLALYTADTFPDALSGIVTLLARTSPRGKLSVDVDGVVVGDTVNAT